MKQLLLLLGLVLILSCDNTADTSNREPDNSEQVSIENETSEAEDKQAILAVMKLQEEAWSASDLEGFMQGYWKNDSLKFFGSSGLTKGWQQTLDNYKKGYPTKEHSGTLDFKISDISKIDTDSYWVMGKYFLTRTMGDANGVFLIIFKKTEGEWKIVADMSC